MMQRTANKKLVLLTLLFIVVVISVVLGAKLTGSPNEPFTSAEPMPEMACFETVEMSDGTKEQLAVPGCAEV